MKFESLKEKYNYYRNLADYRLLPNSYVLIMLDGRSFSKKIKKKFKRPFDDNFIRMMDETAKYVCKNVSGCKIAYVQSDEINLVIHDDSEQEPFFGNRLCKIQSIVASMATSKFNQLMLLNNLEGLPCSKDDAVRTIEGSTLYEFDCKAWNVPNANDAFASLLYRQNDCIRNSKSAVAQTFFSHNELNGHNCDEQIEMVFEKYSVDWNTDFSDGKKYGRFILKVPFVYVDEKNGTPFVRNKWDSFGGKPLSEEGISDEMINLISGEQNKLINRLTDGIGTAI